MKIKLGLIQDIEDEISDRRDELVSLQDELEEAVKDQQWRNDNYDVLKSLKTRISNRGTGAEMDLIEEVLNGDPVSKDRLQRLNSLAIQFLNITLQ